MKYIRAKDGVYELMPNIVQDHTMSFDGETLEPAYYSINHEWIAKKDVINQADTIEELIDEKVLIEENGYPTLLEIVEFEKNIFLRINEYEFATQLPSNPIICGSIWVIDSNGVPTLKPVAKMKGVLPNGEIDWELL